jgi:translation elongation factor EF-G
VHENDAAALACESVAIQYPARQGRYVQRHHRSIWRKAILYRDETLGAEYSVEEIPAEYKESFTSIARRSSKRRAKADEKLFEKFVGGEDQQRRTEGRDPQGNIAIKLTPVLCGRHSRTKAFSRCWTRS